MLQEFGPGIWLADGPVVSAAAGFHYPTRMVVMRLADGGIVIWSPVALTAELRAAIDALGPVRFLVPPNSLHHSFVAEWQTAYPDGITLAPPGLRAIRPDLRFDADITDAGIVGWAEQVEHVIMHGNRITTEIVFFHRPSGTVLFTDLIQHFPRHWFSGWRALVARLDLMVAAEPSVPRKFRIAFTDRKAVRTAVDRVLDWPIDKLVMAHGMPVTSDAKNFLRRAFAWLR